MAGAVLFLQVIRLRRNRRASAPIAIRGGVQRETNPRKSTHAPSLTPLALPATVCAMETTVEYAETHLAQLLRCVAQGEEIILREDGDPVARIVPFPNGRRHTRPQVGEITSAPVRWADDSFIALDDAGMKELGLL